VSPLKTFVNCLVFLHLYLLFYYNSQTVLIVRVGKLNSINPISGLNMGLYRDDRCV